MVDFKKQTEEFVNNGGANTAESVTDEFDPEMTWYCPKCGKESLNQEDIVNCYCEEYDDFEE